MPGIAVVGASDASLWTYQVMNNAERYGYPGDIWLINPNRTELFGRPTHASVAALPGRPEIGVVIVKPSACLAACEELIAAGVHTIAVMSNGFRETGTAEGAALERALAEACHQAGVRMIGPNGLGFASLHDRQMVFGAPAPDGLTAGDTSLISQSGAMMSGLLGAFAAERLGLDVAYSIGNGAAFDTSDALRYLVDRAESRVICAVIEGLPDRPATEQIARNAVAAQTTLVFLLLGQSEGSKRVAATHTGAVLGEGRIAKEWLRGLGVVVTGSVGEMVRAANLVRRMGRPPQSAGTFVMSGSGGAASLGGDLAARAGVPLATLQPETVEALRPLLPAGMEIGNPLDIQPGASPGRLTLIRALAADPGVGVIVEPYVLTWPDASSGRRWHHEMLEQLATAATESGVQAIVSSAHLMPPTQWLDEFEARTGVLVAPGLDETMAALAAVYTVDSPAPESPGSSATAARVVAESRGRELLVEAGLAVVPGVTVADADAAADATAGLAGPWVVKAAVEGLAHKGRVGGVRVGLTGPGEVRAACAEMTASIGADGLRFMVQTMAIGPEILVTALRDPVVGPALVVGIGGWAAEMHEPFGTIVLPADEAGIARAVARWKLPHLVGAERSEHLVQFLTGLGEAYLDGPLGKFHTVECNPVILTSAGALVADVLAVT